MLSIITLLIICICINIVLKIKITDSKVVINLESIDSEVLGGDPSCYEATNVIKNFQKHGNKYVLENYEYSPTITFFNDGYVGSYEGSNCGSHESFNKPVIMVNRFDVFNIYEMFHSLLNTYVLYKMFGLESDTFTIMFVDGSEQTKLNDDMFGIFTSDIIYGDRTTCYEFKKGLYKSSAEFTSLLVTKHGALKGRGTNHHCRSVLLREFVAMAKRHFEIPFDDKHYLKNPSGPTILWSSRGVHSRGATKKKYKPSRVLLDEGDFLKR